MELLAYLPRVIVFSTDQVFAMISRLHLKNYRMYHIFIRLEIFGLYFESHLLLLMKLYTPRQRMLINFTLNKLLPSDDPESDVKGRFPCHFFLLFAHVLQKLLVTLVLLVLTRLLPNDSEENIV